MVPFRQSRVPTYRIAQRKRVYRLMLPWLKTTNTILRRGHE